MSDLDLGYFAGVIDARGHVVLYGHTPRVRVTTRRTELLTYLADRTGVSVKLDERGYERRACSEHCASKHTHVARQSAYWNVDGARAIVVLWNVLPHLAVQTGEVFGLLNLIGPFWPVNPRNEITVNMALLGWTIPTRDQMPI